MKRSLFSVFIVASLMIAISHCFPGPLRQDDSNDENDSGYPETDIIMPFKTPLWFPRPYPQFTDRLNLDVDDSDDDNSRFDGFIPSWRNPLNGFLEKIQNMLNRIHEQMGSGLPNLEETFGLGGKIPEGGNTTSTTKIINGHVVVINETTYQNTDNDSSVVFRVQTVDVKPLNGTNDDGNDEGEVDVGGGEEIETITTQVNETSNEKKTDNEKTTTPESRSVETVEDSAGNEIPNNNKDQVENFNA